MIQAYVNHGRWIAECPKDKWAIEITNQPTFECGACHEKHDIQYPADREEIERLLDLRPEEKNRNWFPFETIADLRLENAANIRSE